MSPMESCIIELCTVYCIGYFDYASTHLKQILRNNLECIDKLPHGDDSRHPEQILRNTPECIDNLTHGNASRHLEQILRNTLNALIIHPMGMLLGIWSKY